MIMPVITSGWHAILAGLTVEREKRGPKWCEEWGVGARRRVLNQILPPNVTPIEALRSTHLADSVHEQREALAILIAHCKLCRGCKLGRE